MRVDRVIRGGLVVTPATQGVADVGLMDGKIVQPGGDVEADEEFDASGKYVLPGGIDMHVHLTSERFSEPEGAKYIGNPPLRERADDDYSRSDFSLYEGWEVTGWPSHTFLRGELIAENGRVVAAPGAGRWVPRGRHQGL